MAALAIQLVDVRPIRPWSMHEICVACPNKAPFAAERMEELAFYGAADEPFKI